LRELETVCDEFLSAAALVIRRCKMHDERVMAHVHFDYTEQETHAALLHDCQEGDACAYAKATKDGKRVWGRAKRPERASTSAARQERHELSAEDPETAKKREKESAPEKTKEEDESKRVRINGCWYLMRDKHAGISSYTGPRGSKKWWVGYYSGKAICHYTGGVVPSVDSASIQEYNLFPKLFDRVSEMAGKTPETAIADRGMSVSSCFEHVTRAGCAPVFRWRKTTRDGKRHDHETHDRHGVMRCKFCGGPMQQVRFAFTKGHPRLWFRCTNPATPECRKEQTIFCSTDWRSLVPLSRTEALYHELEQSHKTYEGVHLYWRNRFKVGGDSLGNRPKVIGLDWHRLRGNTACLIDWLRIAAKCGWLGSTRSKTRHPGTREFMEAGEYGAKSLKKKRARYGLAEPYGVAAKLLGLGEATLPSKRPPPALAADPAG